MLIECKINHKQLKTHLLLDLPLHLQEKKKLMSKVLKVIKFLTIIIFLIVILTVYAKLPEKTLLFISDLTVTKESFFYITLILFFVINFLFSALSWLYSKTKTSDSKRQSLREWLTSLPVAINFYIIFLVAYIGELNEPAGGAAESYKYLLYLGPLLIVVWLIAFAKIILTPAIKSD